MNTRWVATLVGIWLATVGLLALTTGCEPESGPPNAKTDDGKDLRGMIVNDTSYSIKIYRNWKGGDDPGDAKPYTLKPGQQANLGVDWDGFCLPKGRSAPWLLIWGPFKTNNYLDAGKCKKISDGQTAVVGGKKK